MFPRFCLVSMCPFPTFPLVTGSSFSAFDVDHVFQQGLKQNDSASLLHVLNSDLPVSHVSYCVPVYVSFGLSFSSQNHGSLFNSLATKAEPLYKVSKHEPKDLLGMLLVKQCVHSGLAGHLLPPHLFSDLCQGKFPAQRLFLCFVGNATPVPAGTAMISWLLNLLL